MTRNGQPNCRRRIRASKVPGNGDSKAYGSFRRHRACPRYLRILARNQIGVRLLLTAARPMNPGDQREPGIFEPRYHLPKIINCAGLNKFCRKNNLRYLVSDALWGIWSELFSMRFWQRYLLSHAKIAGRVSPDRVDMVCRIPFGIALNVDKF